jgi:outer membrane protein assembly factor BamB
MHHLALGDNLREIWSADIGAGTGSIERIPGPPVIGGDAIFTIDSRARVRAYDLATGKRRWQIDLTPDEEESGLTGGGIAFDSSWVFAATSYGEVFALNAATGDRVWTQRVGVPVSAAPSVADDKVYVVTTDNQVFALDAANGKILWSYAGIVENAGLLGGASVAIDGGLVVVPFSSGELFALRAETGAVVWSDQLVRPARFSSVGTINDINGRPVIDRGRVFAISHSGRMTSIDLRSGQRTWDRDLAGIQSPWVAGDYLYVVTVDSEVVCLSRREGRIVWVHTLERYERPKSRGDKGLVNWYGPVLAGDRLILVSSLGDAVSLSPYTGELIGRIELSDSASFPPLIAKSMLFILTDDAELVAWQ